MSFRKGYSVSFKVGDRVKIIGQTLSGTKLGDIIEIVGIKKIGSTDYFEYDRETYSGGNYSFNLRDWEDHLKLIQLTINPNFSEYVKKEVAINA